MFFDSHAHYDDERFNSDRNILLQEISQNVDYIINCGADLESSAASINLANQFDFILVLAGMRGPFFLSFADWVYGYTFAA